MVAAGETISSTARAAEGLAVKLDGSFAKPSYVFRLPLITTARTVFVTLRRRQSRARDYSRSSRRAHSTFLAFSSEISSRSFATSFREVGEHSLSVSLSLSFLSPTRAPLDSIPSVLHPRTRERHTISRARETTSLKNRERERERSESDPSAGIQSGDH